MSGGPLRGQAARREAAPEPATDPPSLVWALGQRKATRSLALGTELGPVVLLSLLVAGALLGPHVVMGGRYLDDWWLGAYVRFPHALGFGSASGYLSFYSGARPGAVAYWLLTYKLFGFHDAWHRVLGVVLSASMASAFYLLLRELPVSRAEAGAIALLSLALPVADAIHFWVTPVVAQLGLATCAGGMLLALRGLRSKDARSLLLHGAALGLYAVSLSIAETTLPLIGLSLLIYRGAAGWRRAARRWAADLLLVGAAAVHYVVGAPSRRLPGSQSISYAHHALVLAEQAATLFTGTLLPFAGSRPWALAGLLALGAVLAVQARLARWAGGEALTRRWVIAAGVAIVLAAASYVIYVPSDASYQPLAPGVGNRINIGALLPLSVLVFAVARLIGSLFGASRRGTAVTAVAFGALLVVALRGSEADRVLWDQAASHQKAVLSAIRGVLPNPPLGSSLLVFGAPGVLTHFELIGDRSVNESVPVFSTWWELDAAVKLSYGRHDLSAYPIWAYQPPQLACGAHEVYQLGLDGVRHALAYEHVYAVDVRGPKATRLDTEVACARFLRYGSTVRYDLPL